MKPKIEAFLLKTAGEMAKMSNCSRRQFGALIVSPTGVILSSGYNGTAPGAPRLCGGEDVCERDRLKIPSGQRLEVGCIHAEQNAIAVAAQRGVSIGGAWIIITGEPCRSCARIIVAAGITKAIIYGGVYADDAGAAYLEANGVIVERRAPHVEA